MRMSRRDLVATGLVALAVLIYLLWAADSALPGMSSVRVSGLVVLCLGFVASASAVVPTFGDLMHGSKTYLAATSILGLGALAGGLLLLVSASEAGFAVLVSLMGALWLISTAHHGMLASTDARRTPATPRRHAGGEPLSGETPSGGRTLAASSGWLSGRSALGSPAPAARY